MQFFGGSQDSAMVDASPSTKQRELAAAHDFALGQAVVKPSALRISFEGRDYTIEPRVMQMLVALHEAGGATVTKDQLVADCWGGLAISDDAITQCVLKLRRALSVIPEVQVERVPRVGYRLLTSSSPRSSLRKPTAAPGLRRLRELLPLAGVVLMLTSFVPPADRSNAAVDMGAPRTTRDVEAAELHSAAVRVFNERSVPAYAEAERLLRRAVEADPRSAPSWARLAMAVYAPFWWKEKNDPDARGRLRSEALGYARHALQIDPNLAEAYQAMGFILRHDGGSRWLERAAALEPSNPEIAGSYASELENGLELRKADAELARAMQIEPTSPKLAFSAATISDRLGRRSEADAIVDQFERVTRRAGDARRFRFELDFQRGNLAVSAVAVSRSLNLGDQDQWWRQFRLFDIATGLRQDGLRSRLLKEQPRLARIDYADPDYAVRLARTRPSDWWANPVIGGLARQLVMTGNEKLLLMLYDDRFQDVGQLWDSYGDWADCLAPPLILAMRAAGRLEEAQVLRNRFAADISKLTAEGDRTNFLLVWQAQLAALDGKANLAARWLNAAVHAGWKGQAAYRVGFGPKTDPVFALVRDDPKFQQAIQNFEIAYRREILTLKRSRVA